MSDRIPKQTPPEKNVRQKMAEEDYDKFEHANASSATDCTGLMPTPPQNDEEAESYMDIYDYGPPLTDKKE